MLPFIRDFAAHILHFSKRLTLLKASSNQFEEYPATTALLFLGALILAFLGTLLPIYPDEVTWRIIDSRFWLDQRSNLSLYPHCRPDDFFKPPLWWIPFASFRALLFSAGPFSYLRIRLVGASFGFLSFILARLIVVRMPSRDQPLGQFFLILCFVTGTMPFLVTSARPESILIAILLSCFLIATSQSKVSSFLIPILFAAFLTSHPKALISSPVFLALLWYRPKFSYGRIVATIVSLYLAFSSLLFWSYVNGCPASQSQKRFFDAIVLNPGFLANQPKRFFLQAAKGLLGFRDYFVGIQIAKNYSGQWLFAPISKLVPLAEVAGLVNLGSIFFLVFAVLVATCRLMVEKRRRFHSFSGSQLLCGSLLVNLIGLSMIQTHKPYYEAPWILTLLFLLAVTSLPAWRKIGVLSACCD